MTEWAVVNDDSASFLTKLPDSSFDALVTDPPAGIGFMGKTWDSDRGGRDGWIKWLSSVMREVFRLLKPGAHGLVWAIPRTAHWTTMALEDAGFEIRDVVTHHFGSGFPKSHDVSKGIDKAAGAEREVTGIYCSPENTSGRSDGSGVERMAGKGIGGLNPITAPATPAAKQWDGWGTALKPATENWILVRKPLIGTVVANILEHGTGAINVDACRIGTTKRVPGGLSRTAGHSLSGSVDGTLRHETGEEGGHDPNVGRWPANLILSHGDGCEPAGERKIPSHGSVTGDEPSMPVKDVYGTMKRKPWRAHGDADGTETVAAWNCAPGCPVAELDAQSGVSRSSDRPRHNTAEAHNRTASMGGSAADWTTTGHADTGGASRFFKVFDGRFAYVAKPSKRERNSAGPNNHPTLKSIALMTYLIRLITPPGGIVLDPFCGSGTTGIAAVAGGWSFLGIEQDADFVGIAQARIRAA